MVTARSRPRRERPQPVAARVTSKGQITIPKVVREYFDLKPGDDVVFLPHDEGVVIRRAPKPGGFAEWRGYLRDLRGVDVDALVDEMRGR